MLPITDVAGSEESFGVAHRGASSPGSVAGRVRKRTISREAGRGIEMLGHAIEYLADELALECATGHSDKNALEPSVAAIELLKMLNREVYLECPVALTLRDRFHAWAGRFRGVEHALRPSLLPATRRIR